MSSSRCYNTNDKHVNAHKLLYYPRRFPCRYVCLCVNHSMSLSKSHFMSLCVHCHRLADVDSCLPSAFSGCGMIVRFACWSYIAEVRGLVCSRLYNNNAVVFGATLDVVQDDLSVIDRRALVFRVRSTCCTWGLGSIVFLRSVDMVRDDFSITDHGAQLFIVPSTCCRVSKKYRFSSRHRRVITGCAVAPALC